MCVLSEVMPLLRYSLDLAVLYLPCIVKRPPLGHQITKSPNHACSVAHSRSALPLANTVTVVRPSVPIRTTATNFTNPPRHHN